MSTYRGPLFKALIISIHISIFLAPERVSGYEVLPAQTRCGITGHVFDAGLPANEVQVRLIEDNLGGPGQGRDPLDRSGLFPVFTDVNGRFQFPPVRNLPSGRALHVQYTNPQRAATSDIKRVSFWSGPTLPALSNEGCGIAGNIDIANVESLTPAKDAQVFWGAAFSWEKRSAVPGTPDDRIQVCFYDNATLVAIEPCIPQQPVAGTSFGPTRNERPVGLLDDIPYRWYLRISHENGAFGLTRSRLVTFKAEPSGGTATTPSPSPTPTPTASPPPGAVVVCPGKVLSDTLSVNLQANPAQADILFAFDATNSMTNVIGQTIKDAEAIMNELAGLVPDIQFGIMLFRDHTSPQPYLLVQPITGDRAVFKTALALVVTDAINNPDYPEAYTRAMFEAYSDRSVGWRPTSRRLMVMFGDQVPHDDNLNEDIPNPPVNPGGAWCGDVVATCFKEPGRTPQDPPLDLQLVLDTLNARQITLMFVVAVENDPQWEKIMLHYWSHWTKRTNKGGSARLTGNSSSLPDDISSLVLTALSRIDRLSVQASPPNYASWFEFNPNEHRDIYIEQGKIVNKSFDFKLQVPRGIPLGKTHDIKLSIIGDGGTIDHRRIHLFIGNPPECLPPPPPPPAPPFILGLPAITYRNFPRLFDSPNRQLRRTGPATGETVTGIQVQNLDGGDLLNAKISFHEQRIPYLRPPGSLPPLRFDAEVEPLSAGRADNFLVPDLGLRPGIYSAVMSSAVDLPVAAIARTEWTETGAAAIYSNVEPSSELRIPVVVREFNDQTSIISVMSDGNARPIKVELTFFATGSSFPAAAPIDFELQPYEGATVDLLDNHPVFDSLGGNFLGTARLRVFFGLARETDTAARIGAVSFVNIASSKRAVWAFEAIPSGETDSRASQTLFVPLWRSRQDWRQSVNGSVRTNVLDTGIAVNNPNDWPVDVDVTFLTTEHDSASSACRAAKTFTLPRETIAPNSNRVFYQGPGKEAHLYPDDCFGSAVIRTVNPNDRVNAVVNDAQNGDELSSAYNAIPVEQTHKKIAVPLFRNKHGRQEFTTGIQIMNTSNLTATAHIDFFDQESVISGCGHMCDVEIKPFGSHTWYPPDINTVVDGVLTNVIPDNVYGSAVVVSSQPAAVIVVDFPLQGGVDSAVYNGVPMLGEIQPGDRGGEAPPISCPRTISDRQDWVKVVLNCDGVIWQPDIGPEPRSDFEVWFTAPVDGRYIYRGISNELWRDVNLDGTKDELIIQRVNDQVTELVKGGRYLAVGFAPNGGFILTPTRLAERSSQLDVLTLQRGVIAPD